MKVLLNVNDRKIVAKFQLRNLIDKLLFIIIIIVSHAMLQCYCCCCCFYVNISGYPICIRITPLMEINQPSTIIVINNNIDLISVG